MDGGFQKLKTPFIISYKNFQTREPISVVSIKFESPIRSIFHFNISPIFPPQNAKHNFNRNYRFTQTVFNIFHGSFLQFTTTDRHTLQDCCQSSSKPLYSMYARKRDVQAFTPDG